MINGSKKQDFPPIILGNTPANHFQSFLPHDNFTHCSLVSIQKEFEKKDGGNRIKEYEKTKFANQLLSTPKRPTRPVKKKHMFFREV